MNKNYFYVMGALILAGCGGAAPSSDPSVAPSSSPVTLAAPSVGTLGLVANQAVISAGGNTTFSAYGGTSPYYYSVINGTGTISSYNGLFMAPNSAETDTVQVRDQAGNVATAIVTVQGGGSTTTTTNVTISPKTGSINVGQTLTFSATGGSGSYTFALISGAGSMSGAVFTAPSTAQTIQVEVIDSNGTMDIATITVSGSGTTTTTTSGTLKTNVNYGFNGYPGNNYIPVVCLRSNGTTVSNGGWSYPAIYNGSKYYYIGDDVHAMNISWKASGYDASCGKPCIRYSGTNGGWVRNEDGQQCNAGVLWNQLF